VSEELNVPTLKPNSSTISEPFSPQVLPNDRVIVFGSNFNQTLEEEAR
jgi:hypothetical protein